jgi:RNA polymerase primary sigma factor
VPIEDIIAFGNLYLLEAARKWKPNKTASFGAFANRFIRLGINREVARTENIISLPIGITEKVRKVQYHERILTQKLGRAPKIEEVSESTGFSTKRINTIKSILMREPISLDAILSQNITDEEGEE